jgi:hypothetical protein
VDEFRDDPALVAAHVLSVAEQGPHATARLGQVLLDRCWPGGIDDRLDPVAIEWVRRWRRTTLAAAQIDCSCAEGHCGICN